MSANAGRRRRVRLRRQILHFDLRPSLAERDRALDDVLELADVARPVIRHQPPQPLLRHRRRAASELGRQLLQEVLHEERDVVATFAQRRQLDRNHVQPVVEILAKRSFGHHLREIRVRRGDDADVDLDRVRVADAFELALLKHAQQLGSAAPGSSSRLRRGRACPCAPARSGPGGWRRRR